MSLVKAGRILLQVSIAAVLLQPVAAGADEPGRIAAGSLSTAERNAAAHQTNRVLADGLGCTLAGRAYGHPEATGYVSATDDALAVATCARNDPNLARPFSVTISIQFEYSSDGSVWEDIPDPQASATCSQNAVAISAQKCPHIFSFTRDHPSWGALHRAHFNLSSSEGNQLDLWIGPWQTKWPWGEEEEEEEVKGNGRMVRLADGSFLFECDGTAGASADETYVSKCFLLYRDVVVHAAPPIAAPGPFASTGARADFGPLFISEVSLCWEVGARYGPRTMADSGCTRTFLP